METQTKEGFEQELEYKIDIPLDADRGRHAAGSLGWGLGNLDYDGMGKILVEEDQEPKHRVFTYYDTKDHRFLREGWTCRLVSGFDPDNGDGKGLHRYDLKFGEVNTPNRMERSTWSSIPEVSGEVWAGCLNKGVASNLGEELIEVAKVKTTHYKWKAAVGESLIEVSFDTFKDLDGELLFQEVEIELLKGREEDLKKLRDYLLGQDSHMMNGATLVTQQKYARVMDRLVEELFNGREASLPVSGGWGGTK